MIFIAQGSRVDRHYLIGDVIAVQQRETMLTAQHIQWDVEGIALGLNCRYLSFQPVRVKLHDLQILAAAHGLGIILSNIILCAEAAHKLQLRADAYYKLPRPDLD